MPLASDVDLRGFEIVDRIKPLVAPHLGRAMTPTAWRSRNLKAAKSLAEAGQTADAVERFWKQHHAASGVAVLWLSHLQRLMLNSSYRAAGAAPAQVPSPAPESGIRYTTDEELARLR